MQYDKKEAPIKPGAAFFSQHLGAHGKQPAVTHDKLEEIAKTSKHPWLLVIDIFSTLALLSQSHTCAGLAHYYGVNLSFHDTATPYDRSVMQKHNKLSDQVKSNLDRLCESQPILGSYIMLSLLANRLFNNRLGPEYEHIRQHIEVQKEDAYVCLQHLHGLLQGNDEITKLVADIRRYVKDSFTINNGSCCDIDSRASYSFTFEFAKIAQDLEMLASKKDSLEELSAYFEIEPVDPARHKHKQHCIVS